MGGPAGEVAGAVGQEADELEAFGEDGAVGGLHLVGEEEEDGGRGGVVGGVDQEGAAAEEVGVAFEQHVDHRQHQRVARVEEDGGFEARRVGGLEGGGVEADAFVLAEDGFGFAAVAAGDAAVAFAEEGGDVGDLVAAGLAAVEGAAERGEGAEEEGADEAGLEAAGFGAVHLLLHPVEAGGGERFLGEGVAFEQRLQVGVIEAVFDLAVEVGADRGILVVADRLDEQVAEAFLLEDLAEHVEDLALEGVAFGGDLLEEAVPDGALAGFAGHEAPEVAGFGLPDAVDPAKALLQPVGVPRQVIIDH